MLMSGVTVWDWGQGLGFFQGTRHLDLEWVSYKKRVRESRFVSTPVQDTFSLHDNGSVQLISQDKWDDIAGGPEKKMRTLSTMCENFKYPEKFRFNYGPSRISRTLHLVPIYSRTQSRRWKVKLISRRLSFRLPIVW